VQPDIHIINAGLSFQQQTIFHGLNLSIPARQKLALLGASGVGKTSFVRMLAGLTAKDAAISGQINCSNHLPLSQQIAYMAQQDLLLPWLTTLDNVLLTLKLRRHTVNEKLLKKEFANKLLKEVGLFEASTLYPHQLSSGMRQRAALVRTLLEEKPVVLMDEPFAALDTITRFHMQNLSSKLLRDKTVIFITHDPAEALRLADTIYLMHGTPAKIELIATPKGHTPRSLDQATNTALHAKLFAQLVQLDQSA
jgi:putative hydroxymethylpyrimidine transport system ATP-binding protein